MPEVSSSDPRPPYVQIADDLRAQIDVGDLSPGAKLPSGRALADKYAVAPMTVQHALRVLRDEARITTWQGRGAFVAEATPSDRPSPEALARQVDALTKTIRDLDNRIARLEQAGDTS